MCLLMHIIVIIITTDNRFTPVKFKVYVSYFHKNMSFIKSSLTLLLSHTKMRFVFKKYYNELKRSDMWEYCLKKHYRRLWSYKKGNSSFECSTLTKPELTWNQDALITIFLPELLVRIVSQPKPEIRFYTEWNINHNKISQSSSVYQLRSAFLWALQKKKQ